MTTTLIKEALSKSTFHGIPRSVTSPSIFMRLFWATFVCASASVFGYHVSMLAEKYWNDNIVTSSDLRGMKFEFPNIHLCHKIPVAFSYFEEKLKNNATDLTDMRQFLGRTKQLQQLVENRTNLKLAKSSHFFWATQSLYEFITTIGHRSFQTVSRVYIQEKEVDVGERVTVEFVRQHLYCYKIAATSQEMGFTSEAVRLVVYSDRDDDNEYADVLKELDLDNEFSFGLRVYFTKPGTVPNFETQLVHIRPGYFYDIRLKMLKYNLYNSSTRFCYEDEETFVNQLFQDKANKYKLNDLYESCFDTRIQELLVKQCGCFDVLLTNNVVSEELFFNYPACFNVSDYVIPGRKTDFELLLERYKCYFKFNENVNRDILHQDCRKFIPKETNIYTPYWSFMKWPAENSIKTTVNTYIKQPANERNKSKYTRPVPGWQYILNISNEALQDEAVRSTLSEIKIRPQEFFSTVMTEMQQYPVINFWSDIGGILGLYLGVSILTFFEFVELVHNLIGTVLFARKERDMANHHNGKTGTDICAAPNGSHSSTSMWI